MDYNTRTWKKILLQWVSIVINYNQYYVLKTTKHLGKNYIGGLKTCGSEVRAQVRKSKPDLTKSGKRAN